MDASSSGATSSALPLFGDTAGTVEVVADLTSPTSHVRYSVHTPHAPSLGRPRALPPHTRRFRENLPDSNLFQLCLVNRAFWDTVVPMIWEVVPTRHSIKDALEHFPLYEPHAHTKGQHWVNAPPEARKRLYASLIKAITIETPKVEDQDFFDAIHLKPLSKVFPNLRDITVIIRLPPPDLDHFFRDVMGGLSLWDLSVTIGDDAIDPEYPDLIVRALGAVVRDTQPNLRFLIMRAPEPNESHPRWPARDDDIAALLKVLPNLKFLELENMGEQLEERWVVAGAMPRMKDLCIRNPTLDVREGVAFPPDASQSVVTVNVGSIPTRTIRPVLQSINSPNLASLCLYAKDADAGEVGLEGELSDLTRWPKLDTVQLCLGAGVPTWDELLPLLSCRRLEDLSLAAIGLLSTLKDEYIKLMAQAWPKLRKFELVDTKLDSQNGVVAEEEWPTVTLRGLIPLAEHCSSVQALSLSVDARGVRETQPPNDHTFRNVTDLKLQWSIADEEVAHIGAFIARMWAHHENTEDRVSWADDDEPRADRWRRIWEVVDEELRRKEELHETPAEYM